MISREGVEEWRYNSEATRRKNWVVNHQNFYNKQKVRLNPDFIIRLSKARI